MGQDPRKIRKGPLNLRDEQKRPYLATKTKGDKNIRYTYIYIYVRAR